MQNDYIRCVSVARAANNIWGEGMPTIKTEEYLETIFDICQKKGYARVKDVAQALDVGLSTVSEMFQKLSGDGYVNYEKYSGVTLTEKGEHIARELMEKHSIIRDFFVLLDIDEAVADEDACTIEHVLHAETMEHLTKFVTFIQYHDNPMWLSRFKSYCATGTLPSCPNNPEKIIDKD